MFGYDISVEIVLLSIGAIGVIVNYLLKRKNSNFSEIESLKDAWKERDEINRNELIELRKTINEQSNKIDALHLKIDELMDSQEKERTSYKKQLKVWEVDAEKKDGIIKENIKQISSLFMENQKLSSENQELKSKNLKLIESK